MSEFEPGDSVVYMRQIAPYRTQDIPATVMHRTPTGRYRVELHNGAHVTVSFYSLHRIAARAGAGLLHTPEQTIRPPN